MTPIVTTLELLAEGVAAQLAADATPSLGITWHSAGQYDDTQAGIYMAAIPVAPDRIISLSPRQVTADPTLTDAEYALQIRMRGTTDPRTVWALRDQIRAIILGRWPATLPNGQDIRCVEFAGGTPLPGDTSDRRQWSDNYIYRLGEYRRQSF